MSKHGVIKTYMLHLMSSAISFRYRNKIVIRFGDFGDLNVALRVM
jgi:hypothetical protein